ncbi:tetraspanin-18-like [Varanus komodoensis]|uniref:tetraspanin-18-like n=1 Tax=Varanus komodoensis TaxID=61221 RepID=UPI001CF7D893|nr:tetraspanin-18-like [Varanus komodoensis]
MKVESGWRTSIVLLGGLCLLCLGIWQIVDPSGIQKLLSNRYLQAGSYIVVFLGVMLAFMGYVGCYGAISDNPWMLCYFCVTLLMLLMVEITVISLLQFKGKRKVQQDYIWRFMKDNYQGDLGSDAFSRAWNTFMITFECCGVSGPDDFKTSLYFLENQPKDKWPEACCTRAGVGESAPIQNLMLCKDGRKEYFNNKVRVFA